MVQIRFSRGSGLAGWIVREGTWSWASHVGFRLDNGLILDATPELGVAYHEPQDDEWTEYWDLNHPPSGVVEKAVAWAGSQVHKRYDWTAIYGMFVRRDWHRDDKWFCSELVGYAFYQAGWPLVHGCERIDRITPRDLMLSQRLLPPVIPSKRMLRIREEMQMNFARARGQQ